MNAYQTALARFLKQDGIKQDDVAAKIGKTQPALNRYAKGHRFPGADTARLIDEASGGVVPFQLWQRVALDRMGFERSTPTEQQQVAA